MSDVAIATPAYGGMVAATFARSLVELTHAFAWHGITSRMLQLSNESLIPRARNALAALFLESEATHLLFVDADLGFSAADVLAMLKADVDIVCGAYPVKLIDWERVRQAALAGASAAELPGAGLRFAGLAERPQALQEVDRGATGLMLIRRSVLERLRDVVPAYRDDGALMRLGANGPIAAEGRLRWDFFPAGLRGDEYLSEDFGFCRIARANGFKVFAFPARTVHVGSYEFGVA